MFETCQSTVSEHLAVLRRASMVAYTDHAGRRTYQLLPASLREIAEWSARWTDAP